MISSYVLFHVGSLRYALSLEKLERIIMIPDIDESSRQNSIVEGIFNYEGSVIKLLSFRSMISMKSYEDDLKELFIKLKQDHSEWIEELKAVVKNENKTFSKTTDHHACTLGKWLDSFNSYNDDVIATLKDLNYYHQKLHLIAKEICNMKSQKSEELESFFDNNVTPLFKKTIDNLDKLIRELKSVARDAQKLLILSDENKKYGLKVDKIDDIIHIDSSIIKAQNRVKDSGRYIDISGVVEYKNILNTIVEDIKVSEFI